MERRGRQKTSRREAKPTALAKPTQLLSSAAAQPLLKSPPLVEKAEDNSPAVSKASGSGSLPDPLKANLEQLSGLDLSSISVHNDSAQPASFGAWALARGPEIHLAPGQQDSLPHEAWHSVQQLQGRVAPGQSRGGVSANVDRSLEQEADTMGARAASMGVGASRRTDLRQPAVGASALRVTQFAYAGIATVEIYVNAGQVEITLDDGTKFTYPLVSSDLKTPYPRDPTIPPYQSGTRLPSLHKTKATRDYQDKVRYSFSWTYGGVAGQPGMAEFAAGPYDIIFYTKGSSDSGEGKGTGEGEGTGDKKGEGTDTGDARKDDTDTGDGKDTTEDKGTGDGDDKSGTEELNELLKKVGGKGDDVDGTPLTDEERKRAGEALDQLSDSEAEQFLRTLEEVARKCEGDPECKGKGLADLLEFYKNLDEASREALSINQMLKADPNAESDELPEQVLLNIETDAKATANATGKASEINGNLALIQSKITDPKLKKDLESIDLSKLSELNTLLMIQGMLAGASERLPELQPVAVELTTNVGKIRDFVLEEIAWLAAELAATALFSALTAPLSGGTSLAAGAAVAAHIALRLNKLRKIIEKIQALMAVIDQIQAIIATFQQVREAMEKADHMLEEFEQKREQLREFQAVLQKGEATAEQISKMEDIEDELLALMLGAEGKDGEPGTVGMIEKLGPMLDKFFLPDDLSDEELKGLFFDIPDGIDAMDEMLAYKRAVEGGNADQTVTLSLKGFRAGYLLAPFVGFLSGIINDKLDEIMAEQTLAERLSGFGGRKRGGGKFKGSKKKPKKRIKQVKSNKQKREEKKQAAAKQAKKDPKKDEKKKKEGEEKDATAPRDDSSLKWSSMKSELNGIGKEAQEQGGMTKTDAKKKAGAIAGKPEYARFNAKVTIKANTSKDYFNRIEVEDRMPKPKAKPGVAKPKKFKNQKDIIVDYLRPETERHKSLNADIRDTFKSWPEDKADTKDEIEAAVKKLQEKHVYPVQVLYRSGPAREKGEVKVEGHKVAGDIVAWKVLTSVRSGKLAEIVSIPRPGNYWGSKNNPIMVDWPKPAITKSSAYKPIYVGPYTGGEARVTQAELKDHKNKSETERQALGDDVKGRVTTASTKTIIDEWKTGTGKYDKKAEIRQYTATGGPERLPKPSRTSIGVTASWQVKTGATFPFAPQDRGSAAGSTFTAKIALFGYSPSGEKEDGDHVYEIQVGGPDKVENMWSLDSTINQDGGNDLKNLKVKDPDKKSVKMSKLKKDAKANISQGKEMWIKIKSTD